MGGVQGINLVLHSELTWCHSTTLLQGNHFSLLERENEKLQGDIEKLRSELRLAWIENSLMLH